MKALSSKLILTLTLMGMVGAQSEKDTLRGVIEQWAQTVRETQTEQVKFAQDQAVLNASKESLQAEISELEAEIKALEVKKGAADSQSQDTLAIKKSLEVARESFGEQLVGLEAKAAKILPLLPASLIRGNNKLAGAVDAFKAEQAAGEMSKTGFSKRLQNVLTIISEAETFNRKVTKVDEVRSIQGKDQNVSMIYFGLGAGYGANADATIGLVATPSAEGWSYDEKPELAKDILELVNIANGEAQAAFVNLPITIQ